jgi:hypothetical protein
MRPLKRMKVNKMASAGQFRRDQGRTKAANIKSPMRGGWRM